MKHAITKQNSTKKEYVGIDKHRIWSIIGVVLVIGLLVGYQMMKGEESGGAGASDFFRSLKFY